MQKFLHRIACLLFCLILSAQVLPVASAAEGIEREIRQFMIDEGLDASNFSMSYYNPVSGESFAFNESAFLPVGALRFLPTHMYFYEEETRGTFDPQTPEDPEFTIAGMNLEDCRYHSIILSEETVSEKMQAQIGNMNQYLELINQRYGLLDTNTLPVEYWNGKTLSAEFLMNCIRAVSSRPELYNGLMSNYSMVQKADAFANGTVSYPIVQIRSEDEGYITAVAEVSAAQNFLLVASVKVISGGDEILGKLNKLICEYVLANAEHKTEETTATQATTAQNAPNYYIGEERMENDGILNRWMVITFSIAGTLAIIGLVLWLIWRSRNRQY